MLFLVGTAFSNGVSDMGTDSVAHAAGIAAGAMLGAAVPLSARLGGRRRAWVLVLGAIAALALAVTFARVLWGG